MSRTYFYDVELIRARIGLTDVPAPIAMEYLQVLTNLNALETLLAPCSFGEPGQDALAKICQDHHERRAELEAIHPVLSALSRPHH